MINTVTFSERPEAVVYAPLPDGKADVWLRRNIRETVVQEDVDGETMTVTAWTAEEAYMRGTMSREEIERNFDRYFDAAAVWTPEQDPVPTLVERVERLEESGILGRLGDGLFYPADLKPDAIERGSLLLGEARREIMGRQSLAVSVGLNVNLAVEAPTGATEYRLANTLQNRILAQAFVGAAACTNINTTSEMARVISVAHEDGTPVNAGTSASNTPIVITTEFTANKYEPTKTLRVYPKKAGFANLYAGAAGSTSGTAGYSVVAGQGVRNDGNASLVVGNTIYNAGSSSLVTGRNQINHKQNALLAGEGHDTLDARDGVAAVGKYSVLDANTLFAVGSGTSGRRKNAFEVRLDGIVLASPNGTRWLIEVDNDGVLKTRRL